MNQYEMLMGLIRARRSIRRFSARAVGRDDILRLVEAARWAPSNHNRQPWRFIVVEEKREIEQLAERVGTKLSEKLKSLPRIASSYAGDFSKYATFFSQAPVLLVVLHKRPISLSHSLLKDSSQPELVSGEPLSAAMAVQNLLLAAHALGLGGCVLTAPLIVQEAVLGDVNLPAGYDVTCFVAIGYPGETPPQPRRKGIEQIMEFRKDGHQLEIK
jgi:coenzyme F420-0:L-glutamate ligase / coenzyme F420-1:gamma-L-glutamate ligase